MFHIGIEIQLLFNCDMIVAYNSVSLISSKKYVIF